MDATLDEMLPGSTVHDPVNQVISSEELRALVACISTALSELESRVLALYLDGHSYEEVGRRLGCDCKTVDNALQRVKRKVGQHCLNERWRPERSRGHRSSRPIGRQPVSRLPSRVQPAIGPSVGSRPNVLNARNREKCRWRGPWKSAEPVLSNRRSAQ